MAGVTLGPVTSMRSIETPDIGYCRQLVTDGLAKETVDGFIIPWSSVYSLLGDNAHDTSIALLELPVVEPWIARLESLGSPSDPTFAIGVSRWTAPQGARESGGAERIGACLKHQHGLSLLPESTGAMVGELQKLASAARRAGEERLLATGRILSLARGCGAELDDYLSRTAVLPVDRIQLALHREQVLGAPVVTITPLLPGAPASWIGAFDRNDRVGAIRHPHSRGRTDAYRDDRVGQRSARASQAYDRAT